MDFRFSRPREINIAYNEEEIQQLMLYNERRITMKNLEKKNVNLVDGVLFLKGNSEQLTNVLKGVVDILGYDIYDTMMLSWRIEHRENRLTKISVPVRTDKNTWEKIKNYTVKSLVATKEKAVAC
jgi:hypothetical protein